MAITRARVRAVLCHPAGAGLGPAPPVENVRLALDGEWEDKQEELFGPAMPEPSVPVHALAPLGGEGSRVSLQV